MKQRNDKNGRWYNNTNEMVDTASDTEYSVGITIYPEPEKDSEKPNHEQRGFALGRRIDDGRWYLYCWKQQPYSWPTLREAMRVSLVMYKMGVLDELTYKNPLLT